MKSLVVKILALAAGFAPLALPAQFSGNDSFEISGQSGQFLPVAEAFQASLALEDGQWQLYWSLKPGYYLYREQFEFELGNAQPVQASFPNGEVKFDEFFNRELEVYYDQAAIELALNDLQQEARLYVRFQGCADAGYCYPPEWVGFELLPQLDSAGNLGIIAPPAQSAASASPGAIPDAEKESGPPVTLLLGFVLGLVLIAAVVWLSIRRAAANR